MRNKKSKRGPRRFRLQILVTHKCNARCDHCDKAVGYADFTDMQFTPEMMRAAVEKAKKQDFALYRVTLSGGEPVLNPHLQEILNIANELPGLTWGRVLTNDMIISKPARDKIVLPEKWQWCPATLDDPEVYNSGKNEKGKRYRNRVHFPFFISPADHGLEAKWSQCGVRWVCGRGLDTGGWSMCGQAPIIGRILGIDPYPKSESTDIPTHTQTPIPEICRHCSYGLTKKEVSWLHRRFKKGHIPSISPTYAKALEKDPSYLPSQTNDHSCKPMSLVQIQKPKAELSVT